ncbi:hypothetical protein AKO1_008141 [Acrasis kona]|uniref:Uncharacterized protein n=1 Tax=Acrasis kona TaxID=1008807 RepID=A0AAW2YM33_9EUKA
MSREGVAYYDPNSVSFIVSKENPRDVEYKVPTSFQYFITYSITISAVIIVAMVATAVIAVQIDRAEKFKGNFDPSYYSNRTTVFVIVADGFRGNYLKQNPEITKGITRLVKGDDQGLRPGIAVTMNPVFPSKPATNLVTLTTGMYAGEHGIVNKNVYDTHAKNFIFSMEYLERSPESLFKNTEPIWVTADKKYTTMVDNMPGNNIKINDTYPDFKNSVFSIPGSYMKRVKEVLNELDLPEGTRPDLMITHFSFSEVSKQYGPDSKEALDAVINADLAISFLIDEIERRGIIKYCDVIFASVTGTAKIEQVSYLEDIFETGSFDLSNPTNSSLLDLITVANHGSVVDVFLNKKVSKTVSDAVTSYIQTGLVNGIQSEKWKDKFDIYTDVDSVPHEYHFHAHDFPLALIVAKPGGYLLTKAKANYGQKATDGHVNDPEMSGVFVASGPHFSNSSTMFANEMSVVDVYSVLCSVMKLTPSPYNQGSLDKVSKFIFDKTFYPEPVPSNSSSESQSPTEPHH